MLLRRGDVLESQPPRMRTAGGIFQGTGTDCVPNPCVQGDHPGWNYVDNVITLTENEPTYWSAATGVPKGVSPFSVLDPGPVRRVGSPTTGRPTACCGATSSRGRSHRRREIHWNHLKGDATIVNYGDGYAWEYNACAYPRRRPRRQRRARARRRAPADGEEYVRASTCCSWTSTAVGTAAFGEVRPLIGPHRPHAAPSCVADLRQESDGPVTTKANFDVWNENEVKFSGTHRCITCWDQTLLSRTACRTTSCATNLQTDKGKAIDGLASQLCDVRQRSEGPAAARRRSQ